MYLDGEFAFGLARIVAAWLHLGQLLSDEKVEQLKQQDSLEEATKRALLVISYRPRSEAEVRRKLADKEYPEPVIEAVLERLRQAGLLGDEQFARTWVDNRVAFRPRSRRVVAYELRQKGVPEQAIEQALTEMPEEENLAYQTAVRYARRLVGSDWDTYRRRMSAFLARKGFTYDTVAPVVQKVWHEIRSGAGASDENEELDT